MLPSQDILLLAIGAIRFQVGCLAHTVTKGAHSARELLSKHCSPKPLLLSHNFPQRLEKEERERKRLEKLRLKEEAKMKEEIDLYDRGLSARLGERGPVDDEEYNESEPEGVAAERNWEQEALTHRSCHDGLCQKTIVGEA